MFTDIAKQLTLSNRSRMELQTIEETSFHVAGGGQGGAGAAPGHTGDGCNC